MGCNCGGRSSSTTTQPTLGYRHERTDQSYRDYGSKVEALAAKGVMGGRIIDRETGQEVYS